MLNMNKLDWLGMKYYWPRLILMPLMVAIYGSQSETMIISLMAFFMRAYSVNPFAVEEKGKLDNLYLTLPITRKTIVKTRFCLSLLMQAAGLLLGVLLTVLLSKTLYGKDIFFEHNFKADVSTICILVSVNFLFYAIMNLTMFPTLFKLGYVKGKSVGFYIPIFAGAIAVCGLYIVCRYNDSFGQLVMKVLEWAYANPFIMSGILFALAVCFLAISYILSIRLYDKREL